MNTGKKRRGRQWPFVLLAIVILAAAAIFFVRQIPHKAAPAQQSEQSGEAEMETDFALVPPAQGSEKENAAQPSLSDPGWQKSPPQEQPPDAEPEEAQEEPSQEQSAGDWRLLLVNREHPLAQADEIETVTLSCGELVDSRIYPALQQMFDDMRAAGVYPVVASGFRTQEDQQRIYDERVAQYVAEGYSEEDARAETENWVALPGTSEHQTGLAVDINADGVNSYGYEVYDWLAAHAHEYGFIQRYPEDKTDITGVSNEPWHYRYVGEEAAIEIWQSGVCLEEYLKAS